MQQPPPPSQPSAPSPTPPQPSTRADALARREQSAKERYAIPENFLEVEVKNPLLHGHGRSKYVDYEIVVRVGWSFCVLILDYFTLTHTLSSTPDQHPRIQIQRIHSTKTIQ